MKINLLLHVLTYGCLSSLSAQTPELFRDINPGATGGIPHWSREASSGIIYFTANDGVNGYELWRTDGTHAGTYLLKDIVPGSGDSYPRGYTEMNGDIYFSAWTSGTGYELWKTDGTSSGTVMVKDIQPGSTSSIETIDWNYYTAWSPITVMDNHIYFTATDGISGYEIWKSDGTASGTIMLKDVNPGSGSGIFVDGTGMSTSEIFAYGGNIYFAGYNGTDGYELWKSDGSISGTLMIKDIYTGTNGSFPSSFCAYNSMVYFMANNPSYGMELWATNGTTSGTNLVLDINPGVDNSYPYEMVELGSYLYFHADDGTNGRELWRTDGTPVGTILLKDIYPGSGSASIQNLRKVGNKMFMLANTPVEGYEPWISDGTAMGTTLLKDIYTGIQGSYGALFTKVGSQYYFQAYEPVYGNELWQTDGTTAGTTLAGDIYPGTTGSGPDNFNELNGMLFFSAEDGTNGRELWYLSTCDPTPLYIGNDTAICVTADIILDAGTGYSEYLWNDASTDQYLNIDASTAGVGPHSYSVTVTDANGCKKSDTVQVNVLACTGIAEESTGIRVDVFPNPVTEDYFNVVIETAVYTKKYKIEILNTIGQTIYTEVLYPASNTMRKQIDHSGWGPGVYSVRIIGEKGQTTCKVMVR